MTQIRQISILFIFFLIFASQVSYSQSKISFIAIGDWGRQGTHHQDEVAAEMTSWAKTNNADFVISLGDNFYEDGVTSVNDPLWKNTFEDVYSDPSLQVPWYAILGNHDYHGNVQAEIDYTNISSRWKMPARFYSVTQKIDENNYALFVYMDSNPICKLDEESKDIYMKELKNIDNSIQLKWLDSVLSNTDARWKIVCAHQPVISGGYHGGLQEMQELVAPILEKDNVDVFLCGHDHDMQHLVMNNVNYFVSGAGSSTRDCENTEFTKFFIAKTSGFLGINLSSNQLNASFIDNTGKILYSTSLGK